MIIKVVLGSYTWKLVQYLAGPGERNEHTKQRVIATDERLVEMWPDGKSLSDKKIASQLGHVIQYPYTKYRTDKYYTSPKTGRRMELAHFHIIMSAGPKDGIDGFLFDDQWAVLAEFVADRLGLGIDGFDTPWVAINHGVTINGHHHLHMAVSAVSRTGQTLSTHNCERIFNKIRLDAEQHFDFITPLKDPTDPRASRPFSQAEVRRAKVGKHTRLESHDLRDRLIACATRANSEDEYLWLLGREGVLVRPRINVATKTVEGYSVKLASRPDSGWYQASKLSSCLTIKRLNEAFMWRPAPEHNVAIMWQAHYQRVGISHPFLNADPTRDWRSVFTREDLFDGVFTSSIDEDSPAWTGPIDIKRGNVYWHNNYGKSASRAFVTSRNVSGLLMNLSFQLDQSGQAGADNIREAAQIMWRLGETTRAYYDVARPNMSRSATYLYLRPQTQNGWIRYRSIVSSTLGIMEELQRAAVLDSQLDSVYRARELLTAGLKEAGETPPALEAPTTTPTRSEITPTFDQRAFNRLDPDKDEFYEHNVVTDNPDEWVANAPRHVSPPPATTRRGFNPNYDVINQPSKGIGFGL